MDDTLKKYIALDKRIDSHDKAAADHDKAAADERLEGIRDRWEFGKLMLAERKGTKQLPKGRMAELIKATGKSRQDLQYRAQFAERYPTKDEVATAVATSSSWTQIKQNLVVKPEPEPTPEPTPSPLDTKVDHLNQEMEQLQKESDEVFKLSMKLEDPTLTPDAEYEIRRKKINQAEQVKTHALQLEKESKDLKAEARREAERAMQEELDANDLKIKMANGGVIPQYFPPRPIMGGLLNTMKRKGYRTEAIEAYEAAAVALSKEWKKLSKFDMSDIEADEANRLEQTNKLVSDTAWEASSMTLGTAK